MLHFTKASASNSFGFKRDLLGGIMSLVSVKAPNRAQFEAFLTGNTYNFRDTPARRARGDNFTGFYNHILTFAQAYATQIKAMRLN